MKKYLLYVILITFFFNSLGIVPLHAQSVIPPVANPKILSLTDSFKPLQIIGIQIDAKNPFRFDFLLDQGQEVQRGPELKAHISRLSKYFLTALTVPEKDLWVNLSPYEKDRVIPEFLSKTMMGKDLLSQDYLLKQLMASLVYPEHDLGKTFWNGVYEKAYQRFGTTQMPMMSFQKVWIVPKEATVYVRGQGAFITHSHLAVMLDTDYLASRKNGQSLKHDAKQALSQEMVKEIILPALEKEVNEGKYFARLRQIYSAMILATWYKKHLKESILGKQYIGQGKVNGITIKDLAYQKRIYQQYLQSYKKQAYSYVKDDYDPYTNQMIARKYASGGIEFKGFGDMRDVVYQETQKLGSPKWTKSLAMATINLRALDKNGQVFDMPDRREFTMTHPFKTIPKEADKKNEAMLISLKKWSSKMMIIASLAVGGIFFGAEGQEIIKDKTDYLKAKQQIQIQEIKLNKGVMRFDIKGAQELKERSDLHFKKSRLETAWANRSSVPKVQASPIFNEVQVPIPVLEGDDLKPRELPKDEQAKAIANLETPSSKDTVSNENTKTQSIDVPAAKPLPDNVDVAVRPLKIIETKPHVEASSEGPVKPQGETRPIPNDSVNPNSFNSSTNQHASTPVATGNDNQEAKTNALDHIKESSGAISDSSGGQPPVGDEQENDRFYKSTNIVDLSKEEIIKHSKRSMAELLDKIQPYMFLAWTKMNTFFASLNIEKKETIQVSDDHPRSYFLNKDIVLDFKEKIDQWRIEIGFGVALGLGSLFLYRWVRKEPKSMNIPNYPPNSDDEDAPVSEEDDPSKRETIIIRKDETGNLGSSYKGLGVNAEILADFYESLGSHDDAAHYRELAKKQKENPDSSDESRETIVLTTQDGVEGTTGSPAKDAEITRRMQAELEKNLAEVEKMKERRKNKIAGKGKVFNFSFGQQIVDYLGLGTGLYLLNQHGFDYMSLLASGLILPSLTRLSYGVQLWLHEFIGHLVAAKTLKPSAKVFTKDNILANWTFSQWAKFILLPFSRFEDHPFVEMDLSRKVSKKVELSGLGFSAITGLLSTIFLGALAGLDSTWATMALGPVGVAALAVLKGAYLTDHKDENARDNRFYCGIVGLMRWGKPQDLAKEGDAPYLGLLRKMIERLISRGGHSIGIHLTRRQTEETKDGKRESRWVETTVKKMATKAGPNSNVVKNAITTFAKEIPPYDPSDYSITLDAESYVAHTRWATGGKVKANASHPHSGQAIDLMIFDFDKNGIMMMNNNAIDLEWSTFKDPSDEDRIPKQLVNVTIAHNGDNDSYKFLTKNQLIKNKSFTLHHEVLNVSKIRSIFSKLTFFKGELPPGDSPPLPFQILYHLNQGNIYSAARFAHTEIHHISLQDLQEGILTEEEYMQTGDFFMSLFIPFLKSLDQRITKGKSDPWKEMWGFLQTNGKEHLDTFKKNIMKKMDANLAALPSKLTKHWGSQGRAGYEMKNAFVELLLERFFTADRFNASKELMERATGTYGVFVKLSSDPFGITLFSFGQGVVMGFDQQKQIFGFASDPYTMQEKTKEMQFKTLLHMNPSNKEVWDVNIDRNTGKFQLTTYSAVTGSALDKETINSRKQRLTREGLGQEVYHFFRELPEMKSPNEELDDIPAGVQKARDDFENRDSDNYKTAQLLLERILSLWVEKQIFLHGSYVNTFGELKSALEKLMRDCESNATCRQSERVRKMLSYEMTVQHPRKSFLMDMIRHRLIAQSRLLAQALISKDLEENELNDRINFVVKQQSHHVIDMLNLTHIDEMVEMWEKETTLTDAGKSEEKQMADLLIAGTKNGEYLGRIMEGALRILFPKLSTRTVNSNEILEYEVNDLNVNRVRLAFFIVGFGSNFADINGAAVIRHVIGMDNTFGMGASIFSTFNSTNGQSYGDGVKPNRRFIEVGKLTQNEVPTYEDAVTTAYIINLVSFLARWMQAILPNKKPFGLDLKPNDLEKLDGFKDLLVADARRIVGKDEFGKDFQESVMQGKDKKGRIIQKDVHQLILQRARRLASRYLEVPIINVVFWSYVVGFISMSGGQGLFSLLTGLSGKWVLPFEGITTLLLGGYILPGIYKLITGWRYWDRMGPPANVNFVGQAGYERLQYVFLNRLFGLATKGTGSQTHSAEFNRAISELGSLMVRGSLINTSIPTIPDEEGEKKVLGFLRNISSSAITQLKVTRSSVLGIFQRFLSGAISFTFSRKEFIDPAHNISDENIVIGGGDVLPDDENSEAIHKFYARIIDPFGGFLGEKVQWTMANYYSTLGWSLRRWGTLGRAATDTTQAPVGLPNKMPQEGRHKAMIAHDKSSLKVEALSPEGGIDLDAEALDLKEIKANPEDQAMIEGENIRPIHGLQPEVVQVIAITPVMLSGILGQNILR